MKKILITLSAVALLMAACTQNEQKNTAADHAHINHDTTAGKNIMMQAMDESMMAMHSAKQTENIDYDFASMMIPHHEGAIKMAEALLKETKSQPMKNFATNVIAAQNKEVQELKDFLATADQEPSKKANEFKVELNQSMMPMMSGMEQVKLTGNIDQDFVALMIPHHQSAVAMAKAYLPYAGDQKIKKIAEQILKAQQEEIKWLKAQ